jgi:hypothetical protein
MLKGNPGLEYDVMADRPASKRERCKPDYESMIENAKTKIAACHKLLDAVAVIAGDGHLESKLAELVGDVWQMKRILSNRVDALIKEQESWED